MQKPVEPKKILCIHDLSGVGRCSLAVILPVLSVMGFQPAAKPVVCAGVSGPPEGVGGATVGSATGWNLMNDITGTLTARLPRATPHKSRMQRHFIDLTGFSKPKNPLSEMPIAEPNN